MTAEYWIAKYVEDAFRNETRNVGVFVRHKGEVVCKLIGERDDGSLDQRRIRGLFPYSGVYPQWHEYWRECVAQNDLNAIVNAATENFYATYGGFVTDTGDDSATIVADFLYSLLISPGGVPEAYEWSEEASVEVSLLADVSAAFADFRLLADNLKLEAPHPIERNRPVTGKSVTHVPSFTQKNGHLYVMESIDLSLTKQKHIKERAGWMAYMFSDIRDEHPEAESFSIVRPDPDDGAEAVQYARSVLDKTSHIIDWTNENQRNAFLQERRRVALTFG
jgi:hypothetical protein